MTLTEYSKFLKIQYKNYIVLVKFGNFYKCFDKDALILSYLMNYKINDNSVGFPESSLGKVISTLKSTSVNFVLSKEMNNIMKADLNRNNYYTISKQAKKHQVYMTKLEELNNDLKDILKKDIKNYDKIKLYLSDLV